MFLLRFHCFRSLLQSWNLSRNGDDHSHTPSLFIAVTCFFMCSIYTLDPQICQVNTARSVPRHTHPFAYKHTVTNIPSNRCRLYHFHSLLHRRQCIKFKHSDSFYHRGQGLYALIMRFFINLNNGSWVHQFRITSLKQRQ